MALAAQRTNERPMSLSLAEAASLTGLNKTTLLRSIKSGRMTGTKDALGQWQVAEAELLRVYQPSEGAAGERSDTRHDAAAALQAEVNGLKQVAELLRRELDDVRADRDHWREAATVSLRALTSAAATSARRPWWKRLAG